MKLATLLLSGILLAATEPRVSIRVRPQVVMKGQSIWLFCRVPRNADNRLLEYGVADYRPGSQRQLEGAQAPVTWQVLVERIPCEAGPAYCAVRGNDGRWTRAELPLNVAGCEP
jgi:hypothetical protein